MLTRETLPLFAALVILLGIGLGVFYANPRRTTNQCFLFLAIAGGGWLASLFFGFTAKDESSATNCIRWASTAGVAVLYFFNLLRLSIRQGDNWHRIFSKCYVWSAIALSVVLFCQTRLFLTGAHLSRTPGEGPHPVYGPGGFIYAAYFVITILCLARYSWMDLKQTSGAERVALVFLSAGGIVIFALPLILTVALSIFVGQSRLLLWFAPIRVVLFSLLVAYGIATRRVMEVGFLLRKAMSYVVLATYLMALYGLVWWLVSTASEAVLRAENITAAHVIAALAVTLAMAPARGISQSLADRLFIGSRGLDFRATVGKAAAILESITTLPELLRRFAETIAEAVGTDRVAIYLATNKGRFGLQYPTATSQTELLHPEIYSDDVLMRWLREHREPVILDEFQRVRATPETLAVRHRMEELHAVAVLGVFARENLAGIMLLGPRLSGRIYGRVEQDALTVLCGQLGVAVDNAKLFTEVENARIYNEILLQNLTTGVIAADADGHVTVFNQEAEQITGIAPDGVLDRSIDELPGSLSEILSETLLTKNRQEDREIYIRSRRGNVVARASSSIFQTQEGQLLGALMVLTNVTALKRLELQIRRSDRLASLGTLSAGMAHEIKNPLVSIKTFAQLLPERYHESDFRETFSSLIVHEIDRIDSLVNQLLRFARPTKPLLRPMHVHEILEKTLLLIQHRLYQNEVKLNRAWDADVDTIRADSDQLEQVFLNFFLNAMDAMKRGGELTVSTKITIADAISTPFLPDSGDTREVLRISISDTGEGIKTEDLPHVFDPFFTTKDYGTGLGLSVVHGIIQEHGGQIEVESELTNGTSFHIFLPLVHFDEEVAAA